MRHRVAAFAAVGALTVGAVALGVAAPAHAAALIDYRAYQQTLPASVIDGGTLTDDEKVAWTNGTRAGNTTVPVVPVGPVPTKSTGTLPGIFGALGMLLQIGGQQVTEMSFSDDLWWKSSERPDWIPQDEWDACSSGGDASNFFDGFADWTASMNNILGTGSGSPMDCAAIREDWLLPTNADYEPVNVGGDPVRAAYPFTGYSTAPFNNPKTTNFTFDVFWSDTLKTHNSHTRKEGWVLGISATNTADTNVGMKLETRRADGSLVETDTTMRQVGMSITSYKSTDPKCNAWTQCVILAQFGPAGWALDGVTYPVLIQPGQSGSEATGYYTSQTTPAPLPYVNPNTGTYSPTLGALDVVLMTTVRTESGNSYSCTSTAFKESAPTIPKPCEPVVPDWEIITERIVEMVPATDAPSYVPGSNPSRGIQTTTVPDVVRDWQREFPDCDETLCLLDLELEGVGSCFDNPEKCADWYTDPNKTTRYTCTYGGTVVELAQCVKYARLFKPGAITAGTPYPAPGTTNPGSTTSPTQTPTGQTGSLPGTSTAPGTQPLDPSKPRDCWPTGWGVLNPFEWVYKPVRCVMEWAFVPRDAYVQSVIRNMQLKWSGSSLVSLLVVLEEAADLALTPGGCEGPTISLDVYGSSYSGNPLSACADPFASAAQFSFIFTGIAAWVMAIASIARSIAGVVAFKGIGGDSQ